MIYDVIERLHLEQQGAVKMKCWRRNKTQKNLPEPKCTQNRKLTSNVLLESLSMLDLPTSSTSDSLPSSSTSPVLSDMNMRVSQEISSLENIKEPIKIPRNVKNRKMPVQSMQTTDNAIELSIQCPTIIDQNNSEASQIYAMSLSNNSSTITTSNNSTITVSSINTQPIASNIVNQAITSQPIMGNISQSIANNIISQSMANNLFSQSITNTNLKLVNTIANNGQMINITQNINSNNQTLINSNKMVVNSISSNVCIVIILLFLNLY